MSHLVTIQTEIRNTRAAQLAAARAGGTIHNLATGDQTFNIALPGAYGHLSADTRTGKMSLDSDNLHNPRTKAAVDRFLDYYAAELIKLTAAAEGQTVLETELPDGSIRLEVLELT